MKLTIRALKNLIKEATMKVHNPADVAKRMLWFKEWDQARENAGFEFDEDLPIFDVVEDPDMAQLAIEKMQEECINKDITPEQAIQLVLDRDAFAVKYYDPYVDRFRSQLRRSGRL